MSNKTLIEKALAFKTVDQLKAADIYPFFRPLESDQDTEVIINGKTHFNVWFEQLPGLNQPS